MVEKKLAENLNTKAVWAAISSGMGQFQLEEVFRLMDLPAVSQKILKNRNIVFLTRTGKKYILISAMYQTLRMEELGRNLVGSPRCVIKITGMDPLS